MTNLVALDNKNHLTTRIDPDKAELHGTDLHLLPVVVSEFMQVALQYPIVITKNGDTGRFVFAAMLGFEAGENLFWQDGRWQGIYLPLQIRRQPFFVEARVGASSEVNSETSSEGTSDDYIICMDSTSPTICTDSNSDKGLALFDENGRDSEYLQQAKTSLSQLLSGEASNTLLLEHLQQMDLLQTMSLEITLANGEKRTLTGLYTIDQQKLESLPDKQVLTLYNLRLLQAIYALIGSQGQIHALIDLKNKQLSLSV